MADVKDQLETGACWAFATIAYVETMYNLMTHNKYTLSPQQLTDNLHEYFLLNPYDGCEQSVRPMYTGGFPACALTYIQHQGIMTNYDYPFLGAGEKYSYNASYITPIGVRDVTKICLEGTMDERVWCLIAAIGKGVVIAGVSADTLDDSDFIDTSSQANHAVLLSDVCQYGNDTYVAYQNSYGTVWKQGGHSAFLIKKGQNGEFINNHRVLDSLVVASVYNRYTSGVSLTIDRAVLVQLNEYSPAVEVLVGITMALCIIIVSYLMVYTVVHIWCWKKRTQFTDMELSQKSTPKV
jgi:hypothetical protein